MHSKEIRSYLRSILQNETFSRIWWCLTTRAPGSVAAGLTESISPATSWISLASMARSLARSWLILMTNTHIYNPKYEISMKSAAHPKTKWRNVITAQIWVLEAWTLISMTHHCSQTALEHLSPTYLAISSLCAVQSLMYSSCSLECCFRGVRPVGLGDAGAEPPSWATRVEGNGRVLLCLDMWRFEPYSSSDVEAYSTGTRRHREPANNRREWKLCLEIIVLPFQRTWKESFSIKINYLHAGVTCP